MNYMYVYFLCHKDYNNEQKIEEYLKNNIKSNYILYCKNDFIGRVIKRYCLNNNLRCAFIKKDTQETIDRMLNIVPIGLVVCFSNKDYDTTLKYTINECINKGVLVNVIMDNKKYSTKTTKGYRKLKWKISNEYKYMSDIEYSSDEDFDLSCLYKKKEEKRKEVKTTKNQKKILKQHKYMKYIESKNKKYKEPPKKCSLETFFHQSKKE